MSKKRVCICRELLYDFACHKIKKFFQLTKHPHRTDSIVMKSQEEFNGRNRTVGNFSDFSNNIPHSDGLLRDSSESTVDDGYCDDNINNDESGRQNHYHHHHRLHSE
jgi:hypothetical protein